MLSLFKQIVKKNESDILLTLTIILVALVSFGAGLLIDFSKDKTPIIIQNPIPTASIQQTLTETCAPGQESSIEQGRFVGSVNSNRYHWPDCSFAKRIGEENQIWFDSEQEAQDANYTRCGNFERYGP